MKYSNNHSTKFTQWYIPFILGLLQAQMVTIIELVNLINICAQNNIMDIVMNYVALAVVAEFDDYIFEAVKRGDKMPELLEKDMLEIEVTTSSTVRHEEDVMIRCDFKKRSTGNKIARLIYKFCRLLYITVYFYFFEFVTLALILVYPIIYHDMYIPELC